MIAILKIHFSYLYTSKIRILTIFIVFFAFVVLFLQSNIWQPEDIYMIHQEEYYQSFMIEGLTVIKFLSILYITLLMTQSVLLNQYDMFLLVRFPRWIVVVSKSLISILVTLLFGITILLFYIMLLSYYYLNIDINVIYDTVLSFSLFIIFYVLLTQLVYYIFPHIVLGFIPIIGFFISSFSIEYHLEPESFDLLTKILHLLFVDLFINKQRIQFLYGKDYVACLIVVLIFWVIKRYKQIDF
jgi:hypothetical protein